MTATGSERQIEPGTVGMDPYLGENGWHSSSQHASPSAISPPSPPPRLHAPLQLTLGKYIERQETITSH
ncbi:hypothetical protein CesoFtcFv8_020627 [Champsocephalus esox]|uniref:Uncharacterized protein n=2 Tax=Champsocephalus TaxID=52236 RepID=A0AAN8CVU5_CHAGU|nr:hypothetical protein CesoFtcFv8_020627 [Champsocephalus esox]KAK5908068.1 hypothetical protein CgunFtcFv8_016158 [Champsocephalus gunnari]